VKKLLQAFEGVHNIEHPPPKDTFVVAKDRARGTIVAYEHVASPIDVWQARMDDVEHRFIAKKLDLAVERRKIASGLSVTTDLARAIAAAGIREEALSAIDDALEGHVELSAIRPGVRMRLLAEEEWVEGVFARFRVEALEFVPRGGSPLRVYLHEREADGHRRFAGYWNARGQQPYQGAFRSPLPLARITSRFNPKRMHPVLHVVMPHNGVDFGASTGTPVYASAAGTVSTAGDGGACGNMVQIDHGNGLTTGYCHLSRIAPGLHPGQRVEGRELIGYVGATGRATGPHLHFAVKRGGTFIDPLGIKMDGVRVLPVADREAFAKRRAELDTSLDAIAMPAAVADADSDKDDKDEPAGEE
jgi:murein DD-endopeptidase MepM/ murein hydrolase activator NlpD